MHCNEKYCLCWSYPLIRCGGVYAFDSQIMEEMILYHGRITSSSIREAPSASNDGWRSIYTLRDAKSCVNKIQAVRYRENIVGVSYRLNNQFHLTPCLHHNSLAARHCSLPCVSFLTARAILSGVRIGLLKLDIRKLLYCHLHPLVRTCTQHHATWEC